MSNPSEADSSTQLQLERLSSALESGAFVHVRQMLNSLPAAQIAHLLESSPHKIRQVLWRLVEKHNEGEVINHLGEELQTDILTRLSPEQVASITEGLETDDLADILRQLPDKVIDQVLLAMKAQDRQRLEAVLSYSEDTAGALLNTDTISVRADNTLDVVLRYLRWHKELPDMTDSILVVDRNDLLLGVLPLGTLLISDPHLRVEAVMKKDYESIPVDLPSSEVARLFEQMDLISAPVVDEQGRLLGRITIDDVVDVIREDADHSLLGMVGLDEEHDTFAPVLRTARRRAVWLGINLFTAFTASLVIAQFSATIDQVVALAILMTVVASMGGVTGNQALTLVIRSQALGQIGRTNALWLMRRELGVGLVNGLLWASVAIIIIQLWFGDGTLGAIFAGALLINMSVATLAGALLPLLLKALRIDPALAGSMLLTTISDVVGFLSFLGLATLFY